MLNEVGSVYIPNDFLETNQLGYELAKQGAYFAANVMNNEIDVFAGDMAWLLDAAANISSLLAAKIVNQNFLQSTVEKIDAIKKCRLISENRSASANGVTLLRINLICRKNYFCNCPRKP